MALKPRPKPSMWDRLLRATDIATGTPDIDSLPVDHITIDGKPYLDRHFILGAANTASTRIHHIMASDSQHLHDHPWDFATLILEGSYTEHTTTGATTYKPGDMLLRPAEHAHRLQLNTADVWTYVTTSQPRRRWGFHTPTGWTHWADYQQ